jgi:hypothetical protein
MVERRKTVAGAGRKARTVVRVDAGERRHLIEACAFFRADRYRAVEPGGFREADLRDAAAEIDAVLGKRKQGRRR